MHIDLLICENKFYSYESYMATQLAKAFDKMGVSSQIFSLEHYLYKMQGTPPDWTIAFEPLLNSAQPLCDITCIPHIHWEGRSLAYPAQLLHSTYGKVAITRKVVGHPFSFLPHAVEMECECLEHERPFDVVLFADLVDVECKKAVWQELFSPKGCLMLHRCLELCLKGSCLPFEAACMIHLEDPEAISLYALVINIEEYLRAIHVRTLIESFNNDVRIDVFGEHIGNNWLKRLKSNVFLHSTLPYIEHFEVLKMAKIALCLQEEGRDGSDEWLLPALSAGCLPLTPKTSYLEEMLGETTCLFFPRNHWTQLSEKVNYFLSRPKERFSLAEELSCRLAPLHSFEDRAKTLYEIMERE